MSVTAAAPIIVPSVDPVDAALAFYDAHLKAHLEPEFDGQVVAIHGDSGDYAIGPNSSRARFALRARQPGGPIVTLDIGPPESLQRSARWLLDSPATWRRSR